jgi:short-subunit dehydrogenase
MRWSLSGKTAIVTGASAGIGLEVARALVGAGMNVALVARRPERLRELAIELGPRALAVCGDLASAEDRERMVRETRDRFGPIHLLVNNAGYGQKGPVELVPLSLGRAQFEVNLFAAVDLMRLILPDLRQAGGRIINVSSMVSKVPLPFNGWYAASKAALEAISDALRRELLPFDVKVVLIEPGPVATEFFDVADQTNDQLVGDRAAYEETIQHEAELRMKPKRTRMSPAECAQIILGAASAQRPRARYVVTRLAHVMIWLDRLLPTWAMDWVTCRANGVPTGPRS